MLYNSRKTILIKNQLYNCRNLKFQRLIMVIEEPWEEYSTRDWVVLQQHCPIVFAASQDQLSSHLSESLACIGTRYLVNLRHEFEPTRECALHRQRWFPEVHGRLTRCWPVAHREPISCLERWTRDCQAQWVQYLNRRKKRRCAFCSTQLRPPCNRSIAISHARRRDKSSASCQLRLRGAPHATLPSSPSALPSQLATGNRSLRLCSALLDHRPLMPLPASLSPQFRSVRLLLL